MSYTNGFQTLVQSMNGLLTFNDGAGTVIENGNITTQALTLDNIYATVLNTTVSLWNNLTGGIGYIMNNMTSGVIYVGSRLSTSGFVFLGSDVCTVLVGIFTFKGNSLQLGYSLSSILNLFTTFTGTINFGSFTFLGTSIQAGTSSTVNLFSNMTAGTINFGSSLVTMVLGSFTFLGTSIQAGTSGTFNFFTNVASSSNVNFFSNMPSGTFNIGKGGNINLGRATTGLLLKLDGDGLDNQVLISTQQTGTGIVTIGNEGVTKLLGTTTTVGGTTVNVGNQNAGLTSTTLNLGTIGLNTGTNRVNVGLSNTNTTINGGGVSLGVNTTGGYFYPSFLRLQSGADNVELFFRGASATLNNTYETLIKSYSGSIWSGDGLGLQQMFSGQQEFLYNGSFVPRNLPTFNGLGLGYYNGGGGDNASTISGYGPYGGVRFGGCGSSNNKGFSTNWGQSMVTYPGYGTRFANGGLSFDKGTLSVGSGGDRGWVPQCGVYELTTTTISGNGTVQVTMTFGYTYSANPYVTVTMIAGATGGNTDRLIPTVYEITTTQIKVNITNTSGGSTGGNQWGFHYIAWGPY